MSKGNCHVTSPAFSDEAMDQFFFSLTEIRVKVLIYSRML